MERAPKQPLFLGIARVVIVCLGVWMILATSVVLVLALLSGKPVFRARICMGSGLVLLWNVLGGLLMYRGRDRVRRFVVSLPGWWPVKFVTFSRTNAS